MTGSADNNRHSLYRESSASAPVDFDPFAASELVAAAPATEPQREIWAAAALGREASLAYNESVLLELEGSFVASAMARALETLAARHECLRSTFGPDGQMLCVAREIPLDTAVHDADLDTLRRQEVTTPFDLVNGPLFRCRIVRVDAQHHAVLLTAHHTVCDGWSFGVLLQELAALYNAQLRGEAVRLEPAPAFREHAERQAAMDEETRQAQEAYWREELRDAPARLEMPADFPRPARRAFAAHHLVHRIPAATIARLRARGAKRGCTAYTVLATAFTAWLHRLTGQDDLVLGVPAAGQAEPGLEGLVGHCVSLLPLRSRIGAADDFNAMLDAFGATLADGWEHRGCSMGRIVQALRLPRDPAIVPLVQVILNIDRRINLPPFEGLRARFEGSPRAFENFEMFVNAIDEGGGLLLECTFDASLHSQESMRQRFHEFEHFLAELAASEAPVHAIPLLTDASRSKLLAWSRGPDRDWPESTVDALVRAQCRLTPESIAVHCGDDRLDYAALGNLASLVREGLRGLGVGAGDVVAVSLARDITLPAALLGVLESGAAYLPIDPEAPAERVQWMLADAGAKVFLVDDSARLALTAFGGRVVDLASLLSPRRQHAWQGETAPATENPPASTISTTRLPNQPSPRLHLPADAAYLIYTSGSTGKPKGVVVRHRGVANFLRAMQEILDVSPADRFLAVTTLSFDIAALELWLPLVAGASVDVVPRDVTRSGEGLRAWTERHPPDIMQATPATWQMLLDAGWQGGALRIISGGEALPLPLAHALRARCSRLWNFYGPTETTIWSTAHAVEADDTAVPIGRPIANTQVYIVDATGALAPPGAAGELLIGGDGVAAGYLNREELTRERFIDDPFNDKPGRKLYRTGDRVRFNAAGVIEYLGRVDFQIKLRGHRIEPGEIEAVLESHPGVARAAVVMRDIDGDARLVAYHVTTRSPATDQSLRAHLLTQLPGYMIPQHFVALDAMPLTGSGKIDRKALPAPNALSGGEGPAPRTDVERRVAAVWSEVLGIEGVTLSDNFFELGGHSLLAARCVTRLREEFNCTLPISAIFDQPILLDLAGLLERKPGDGYEEPEVFEL